MASTAISAQGSSIAINTAESGEATWTKIKNVISFTGFDGAASEIDVTDLDSTAKEYRLGLQDYGKFSFEMHIDRTDAGQLALEAARKSGKVVQLKLTLPDGEAATFNVLVKSTPISGGIDAVLKGSVETRITGDVEWA
ncbi:hypothetical protein NB643_04535 [Oxalobacter aliiformigenes]|uniref:Phage tail protein n=1 Tax=Oxalobacter aliiformigenes TaxID=2946593 RepID=A0ABY7JKB9_9BURK|nr:phage tail tube protein [Oxalobacter aliiformigenes]WAV92472.1 hypothetical protein NB641_06575 [Oxalobacter aliiformigenes]WAV96019.1 hypothetical protein NB643_04535 [Oxalobacter aliiformigenes]WAV98065.1 hypothetical protein NB645_04875 [Oxalobacter aliiformigenes]